MTKQECEQQMLSKLKEIWDIFKEYDPQSNHLSLCAIDGNYFTIFGTSTETITSVNITEVGGETLE